MQYLCGYRSRPFIRCVILRVNILITSERVLMHMIITFFAHVQTRNVLIFFFSIIIAFLSLINYRSSFISQAYLSSTSVCTADRKIVQTSTYEYIRSILQGLGNTREVSFAPHTRPGSS